MEKVWSRFAVLLAVPVLLAGCLNNAYVAPEREYVDPETGEVSRQSDAKELESGIIKAFPDIPIPATHKIDLDRSVIFASPNHTMGKIALVGGSGNLDSLFRFFETQMAAQGWSLVNSFQSGTSSMYYAKPGRFVAIIIEAQPRNGSRVFINVGPE